MAFKTSSLSVISRCSHFTVWSYETQEENLRAVLKDGFFNQGSAQLREADMIVIHAQDKKTAKGVSTDTGQITLSAL